MPKSWVTVGTAVMIRDFACMLNPSNMMSAYLERAKLFSLDKATGLIEGHVTALINDLIAVKYDELLEKVKRSHPGVDEKLLGLITEELDIKRVYGRYRHMFS